jgi:hypothetical protein
MGRIFIGGGAPHKFGSNFSAFGQPGVASPLHQAIG